MRGLTNATQKLVILGFENCQIKDCGQWRVGGNPDDFLPRMWQICGEIIQVKFFIESWKTGNAKAGFGNDRFIHKKF
jgi:hypothetical protein